MQNRSFLFSTALCMAAAAVLATGCDESEPTGNDTPQGPTVYGLTIDNKLVSFKTGAPGQIVSQNAITGLMSNEVILGLDFRPSDLNAADGVNKIGRLYGVSNMHNLYAIDLQTGAASDRVAIATPVDGSVGGFGFNPVPDRIRLHSTTGQSLRINPDNGVTVVDSVVAYMSGDANFGQTPLLSGSAYTNSDSDTTTGTALYAIDITRKVLVDIPNANAGQLRTIGSLGIAANVSAACGFDIVGTAGGTAYAAMSPSISSASTLYTVNLSTGQATSLGAVGGSLPLVSIAVAP